MSKMRTEHQKLNTDHWLRGKRAAVESVQYSVISLQCRAFTLIELMVVVGILAVVMTIAIPSIYQTMHKDSLRAAVSDVMEMCSHARAYSILNGVETGLRIRPGDRQLEVVLFSGRSSSTDESMGEPCAAPAGPAGIAPVRLPNSVRFEMVDVNFIEYKDREEAVARFYPNGTSDEMTLILLSDQGESRKISLEVVTALADLETDPMKFR